MSEILTSVKAAEILGFRKEDGTPDNKSLSRIARQGRIPFYKRFGRLYFIESELLEFIRTGTPKSNKEAKVIQHLQKHNRKHLKKVN